MKNYKEKYLKMKSKLYNNMIGDGLLTNERDMLLILNKSVMNILY